jgi:hypothetical protein
MSSKVTVLKMSGEREPFSRQKVVASLKRAGAKESLAKEITSQVERELYEGIPTRQIYSRVFALLREKHAPAAFGYNLRQAVMQLGPTGYPFEKFVAGVLVYEGYRTKTNQELKGRCVSHEVDVVAQKSGKTFMLECKFHTRGGIRSDIKDALYVYGRFLDLKEFFEEAWLVTNTKVSAAVKDYSRCVGLKVISWDYPRGDSLQEMIERSGLHPLTSLTSLSGGHKKRLLSAGTVFCQDLTDETLSFLPKGKQRLVREEVASLGA